jgi:hypothetical protein
VERVRAGVADKLGRGVYSPADLEEVRCLERTLCEASDSGPAPADDLALLHATWDPLGPHTFTSHRAGIGALVVAAKQWLRKLARPVAAVALPHQAEFNLAVARLLTGASRDLQLLEAGAEGLRRRIEELECRNLELAARCDELRGVACDPQARPEPGGGAVKPT